MFFAAASTGSEDLRRLADGPGWSVVSIVILAILSATFVSGHPAAAAVDGPGVGLRVEGFKTMSPADAGGQVSQVFVHDRWILVCSSETTVPAPKPL